MTKKTCDLVTDDEGNPFMELKLGQPSFSKICWQFKYNALFDLTDDAEVEKILKTCFAEDWDSIDFIEIDNPVFPDAYQQIFFVEKEEVKTKIKEGTATFISYKLSEDPTSFAQVRTYASLDHDLDKTLMECVQVQREDKNFCFRIARKDKEESDKR
jgi:hypothetical protein